MRRTWKRWPKRPEYEVIVESGLILQVDCPDLAMGRHIKLRGVDDDEFLRNAALQVEVFSFEQFALPAGGIRPNQWACGRTLVLPTRTSAADHQDLMKN